MRRLLFFVLAATIVLSHIGSYGWTFDEAQILHDAQNLIAWVKGLASTEEVWFGHERPSPAKALAALGVYFWGQEPAAVRFFPALLWALAATTVYTTVRTPCGSQAARATFFALLLAPPFFGFSAQASNESVVSSLILIMLCRAAWARSNREWLIVGLIGGVALGAKITALVALLSVPAWAISMGRFSKKTGLLFSAGIAVGFIVTWPPIVFAPEAAWEHVLHFANSAGRIGPFPSWHYALFWLAIGLPPAVFLLGAGEAMCGRGPLHRLLTVYLAVGIFTAVSAHDYLGEGIRHLLPLAVVFAVLAGLSLGRVARFFPKSSLILFLLPFLISLSAVHPTETFYISEILGGPGRAEKLGLPVTSSGDILNDNVLAMLPEGAYSIVSGARADRSLNFGNAYWRELVARRASSLTGRPVRFTSGRRIVLGPGDEQGTPLLVRKGVTYARLE